jgi:hypothetical protein
MYDRVFVDPHGLPHQAQHMYDRVFVDPAPTRDVSLVVTPVCRMARVKVKANDSLCGGRKKRGCGLQRSEGAVIMASAYDGNYRQSQGQRLTLWGEEKERVWTTAV